MLKGFKFWYWLAGCVLILSGIVHSIGHYFFFIAERHFAPEYLILAKSMQAFTTDPRLNTSLWGLLQMFSLSYSLLLIFAGLVNLVLIRSDLPLSVVKKLSIFNLVFWLVALLLFLFVHPVMEPIIISGMTSLKFAIALWRVARSPDQPSAAER